MRRLLALSRPSDSPNLRFPWQPPSCWSWIAIGWGVICLEVCAEAHTFIAVMKSSLRVIAKAASAQPDGLEVLNVDVDSGFSDCGFGSPKPFKAGRLLDRHCREPLGPLR